MSLAFAIGLAIGSGVIVFGRDTRAGRRWLVQLHLRLALLRHWIGGGR